MQIIRRADFLRMPWKNGKGLTEEIMAFPPGSSIEDFDWRLSLAHVETDGPFSVFPGVDRTIALLEGNGMVLDLPQGTVTLTAQGAPYAFPGEWAINSRNLDGPTLDFNLMSRRGTCSHQVERTGNGLRAVIFYKDRAVDILFEDMDTAVIAERAL